MTQGRIASTSDIVRWRLHNHSLARPRFDRASNVVAWMGAVQAQDFAAAKWALGQRMTAGTDTVVGQAFDAGAILRTHVLRPTWHFVLPADIRWMLALSASRVKAASTYQHRKVGVTPELFRRCNRVFEKTLTGGREMTRVELGAALARNRITLHAPVISRPSAHDGRAGRHHLQRSAPRQAAQLRPPGGAGAFRAIARERRGNRASRPALLREPRSRDSA